MRAAPVPAIRRAERSARSRSSSSSTRAHWVGTPWATVTPSATITSSASVARHGVGVITVVISWTTAFHARVMYPTWAKGSGESRRSPGRLRTSVPAATAARFAWSKTAPLGRPVVPLVHTTATGSDGSGRFTRVGPGPSSAAATSARSTTVPRGPREGHPEHRVDNGHDRVGPGRDALELGRPETRVHPARHRPQRHGRRVADGVVDRGGQDQADHVTPPHPGRENKPATPRAPRSQSAKVMACREHCGPGPSVAGST